MYAPAYSVFYCSHSSQEAKGRHQKAALHCYVRAAPSACSVPQGVGPVDSDGQLDADGRAKTPKALYCPRQAGQAFFRSLQIQGPGYPGHASAYMFGRLLHRLSLTTSRRTRTVGYLRITSEAVPTERC